MSVYEGFSTARANRTDGANAFVKVIFTIILVPCVIALVGITYKLGWQWFMVPLGLPSIGMAHAMGLAALIKFVTWHSTTAKAVEKKEYAEVVAESLAVPACSLLFMWLFKLAAF